MSEKESNCSSGESKSDCSSNKVDQPCLKQHWETSYSRTDHSNLGWYQESATESISMLSKTNISNDEKIVDIGSGASVFIDDLINSGRTNIVAADICEIALNKTKERLSEEGKKNVSWIIEDITKPNLLKGLKDVALWHDRAVFHFLTDEKDRETYFNLLDNSVQKGKFVVIATFNLDGAERCSGLPVQRYDEKGLAKFLGENYQLIDFFDYDYIMPSGNIRPYVYTLFQKK